MDIPVSVEPLIEERMKTGLYDSVEDLLRAALARLDDNEDSQLAELRRLVQEGLDEIERGDTVPAEQVFAELRARSAGYGNEPRQG